MSSKAFWAISVSLQMVCSVQVRTHLLGTALSMSSSGPAIVLSVDETFGPISRSWVLLCYIQLFLQPDQSPSSIGFDYPHPPGGELVSYRYDR